MRIVEPSPNWIRFTCQRCKAVYEIEKNDVQVSPEHRRIKYGSLYVTIHCPACNEPDYLSHDLFPVSWIQKLQGLQ